MHIIDNVNNLLITLWKNNLWGNVGNIRYFLYLCSGKEKQKPNDGDMTSTFIGNIEAKLDEKGRMFIPAVYRKILASEESQRIVMRRDTENECLVIYPERVWNQRVEQLSAELDEWNPDDQMLLMQFVADAEFVEPDSQGRILLQKRNLQQIGATGELLIVGMMNRFAIWDKQTFLSKRIDQREFAKTLRERMGKKHS